MTRNKIMLVVTILVVLLSTGQALIEAAPPENRTRTIRLFPPVGSFLEAQKAGGTVSIVSFETLGLEAFMEFSVKNIGCQLGRGGDEFYVMYATTATTGTIRLFAFNTACTGQIFHSDFPLPETGVWFTEDVVIEIVAERDDGADECDLNLGCPSFILRGEDFAN